jgi:DNA-binding beta-propeller fold protein YncE
MSTKPELMRDDLWSQVENEFTAGSYDSTIFNAHRYLESVIQKRVGNKQIGYELLATAFNTSDPKIVISDEGRDISSLNKLYDGAIGFFKGDRSHGEKPVVEVKDQTKCLRILLGVCALLDLLDADKLIAPVIKASTISATGLELLCERIGDGTVCFIDRLEVPIMARIGDKLIVDVSDVVTGSHNVKLRYDDRESSEIEFFINDEDEALNWHKIVATGISLYSDAACKDLIDTKGIILESYEGGKHIQRCFPSDKSYQIGIFVEWEWDFTKINSSETWLKLPGTGKPSLAWSGSAFFIGKPQIPKYKERLEGIKLFPRSPHVMKINESGPWRVIAKYGNGIASWEEDVSQLARPTSTDMSVLSVDKLGSIHSNKFGKAELHAVFDKKFKSTEVDIAAFSTGTVRDYVGGIKHPNGLNLSTHGLLITNQSDSIGCIDSIGVFKTLTRVKSDNLLSVSLDQITSNNSGTIFVRSVGDRSIVIIHGVNLDRLEFVTLPDQLLPTDMYADNKRLFLLVASGDIWKYTLKNKTLECLFKNGIDQPQTSMAKCLKADDDFFYILDNMNNLTKVSRDKGQRSIIPIPSELGNQYADFDLHGSDIMLTDFQDGKLYKFDWKKKTEIASGMENPNGIAVDKSGKVFIANFGSDIVSVVDL